VCSSDLTKNRRCFEDRGDDVVHQWISFLQNAIDERVDQVEGSGWNIEKVDKFRIILSKNEVGIIGTFKEYPADARGQQYIFNVNNNYNCVITALTAYKLIQQNPNIRRFNLLTSLKSLYRHTNIINTKNIVNDITWDSLSLLEKDNNMSIYVYALRTTKNKDKNRYTIHLARKGSKENEANFVSLLLLNENHVCLISNLVNFYRTFCNSYEFYIASLCKICLTPFKSINLEKHPYAL